MIYLDWAATALPDTDIINKSAEIYRSNYANPSAVHTEGEKAHQLLEECRKITAVNFNCSEKEIIFTSGGTESNNLVINSLIYYTGKNHNEMPHIITSSLEHDSVYSPVKWQSDLGIEISFINPSKSGFITPESVKALLKPNTRLISIILASNETGAIQPLAEIAQLAKAHSKKTGKKIIVHTDAVQAFGKIPVNPYDLGIDTAACSAHKIGGPKGVGILFIKKGCSINPVYKGGKQEMGIRPGTENLPGIYGLSLLCSSILPELKNNYEKAAKLMKKIIDGLAAIPDTVFIPESRLEFPESFSPYILKVAFPPVPGEVLVRILGEKNICISTGSACASRKKNRQRAILSMGISEKTAYSAVRISIGYSTTEEEIDFFIKAVKEELNILKQVTG